MARRKHPHILKICSDQHSAFVSGFAGDPWVRTPNLNRLAERGIVFENHYAANPVCCPGRNAMLCGTLPREIGTCYFEDELPLDVTTYMRHFSQHGYMTICSGKMHFHGPEQMYGWQLRPFGDLHVLSPHYIPGYCSQNDVTGGHIEPVPRPKVTGSYNEGMLKTARPGTDQFMAFDRHVTSVAADYLRDYFTGTMGMACEGIRPLLFEVSYVTPHCPFVAPLDMFNHYLRVVGPPRKSPGAGEPPMITRHRLQDQPPDITGEMIRRARAGYWGLVQWMDHQVGIVLEVLEQLGVLDEFIIMYCSDHGETAGERGLWQKNTFYEESVRCPMILAGGDLPRGMRVTANTSHYDLLPTLCDLAGLPEPAGLRGRSMLGRIGEPNHDDRIIFSELYGRMDFDFEKSPELNSAMAKQRDMKFVRYADGFRELFDLGQDPDEQTNLAGNPAHAAVEARLDRAIEELPAPWRNLPSNPLFPASHRPSGERSRSEG